MIEGNSNWPFSVFKVNILGQTSTQSKEWFLCKNIKLGEQPLITKFLVLLMYVHHILFSNNVPSLCWLSTKLFCGKSKNSLRMFICMQKSVQLQLLHYEIPQLSLCYYTHCSKFFSTFFKATYFHFFNYR